MKVLFCSSEVYPFSKTGGLADIADSLPQALNELDLDVRVITPFYLNLKIAKSELLYLGFKELVIIDRPRIAKYYFYQNKNVKTYFIESIEYFNRDLIYGYHDDAERFAFFCYAILEGLELLNFIPNIIHINDWQTSIIPYLLDELYRHKYNYLKTVHTLLTIHNIEYQGSFPLPACILLPKQNDNAYILNNQVNYLKVGIERATKISTVSNTYRNEILTDRFAYGLNGVLLKRQKDLVGILNGINTVIYDPLNDPALTYNYDIRTFSQKKKNKVLIYKEFAFINQKPTTPLIVYIGRLAHQKGLDLFYNALIDIMKFSNANIFLLGTGDEKYVHLLEYLHGSWPERIKVYIGFENNLAKRLYAAADLFIMPSEFEPCGLGQMIAMRYGAVPVVRETGGLYDTVEPYNEFTNTGVGFTFRNISDVEFKDAIYRGLNLYNSQKIRFNKLAKRGMALDFSNKKMAINYADLYKNIF